MESQPTTRSSLIKNQSTHQATSQNNHNCDQQVDISLETLDFDECLKDSPKFRQILKHNLNYIDSLESCISRTIKQVNNYIDTGREHIKAQQDFMDAMKILSSAYGSGSNNLSKRVNILMHSLNEIMRLHEILIDQTIRTVGTSFNKFITDDILKIREARKSFDKISHEYDQALIRHSQPAKKQHEDSENLLIATSTAFAHTSLDLSIQITALQAKKGYDVLHPLLSFTKAYGTFFHQGFDLFTDLKPHISDVDNSLSAVREDFETLSRSLPSKHLMVSNNELKPLCFDNKALNVHLEGYLFKRASNRFKVWNRRWFILRDHQLLYQKRGDAQPNIMEEDLRLLTVRPAEKVDGDRRFCFEVLSPQKSHILQADTEAACQTWITAIQTGINAAFHDTEHKSIIKSPGANEMISPGTNSWATGFSLKLLQQQASNRLCSMTTIGELKDITRTAQDSHSRGFRTITGQDKVFIIDSDDDKSDQEFKVDEQGRSYAPLQANDDADTNEKKLKGREYDEIYPPAVETNEQSSHIQSEPPTKPQRAYMRILALPGNDSCADCGASQPQWASINLGITLCIECAGIHRSLGVHLSKVRSLTLDTEVWSPEIVKLMLSLGNTNVNAAKLACFRSQMVPIVADSSREEREKWIKAKYLLKSFTKLPCDDYPDYKECSTNSANSSFEKDAEQIACDRLSDFDSEDMRSVNNPEHPNSSK